MALVTISGFPCSGKTTRALQIKAFLEQRQSLPVILINDEAQNLSRQAYDAATSEKSARAALFSAVIRNLSPERIVIFDSLNYIKGYRYQLYCAARESRCRTCTVHIATPPDQCTSWNAVRGESQYTQATLDNLISRYEEPSPFVRWDSPLVTIPWDTPDIPEQALYDAIFSSELKPPTQATIAAKTGSTDYLTLLDTTSSSVITALLAAQSASPGGGAVSFVVDLPSVGSSTKLTVELPMRMVTMPQLQRLKRQFVGLHKQTGANEFEAGKIAELFAKFVGDEVH